MSDMKHTLSLLAAAVLLTACTQEESSPSGRIEGAVLTFTATKNDNSYGPFYYMLQKETEWKAGYKYTYNVTITLYGLQVSVDTGSMTWGDGVDGEGSVEHPI